MHIIHTSDHGRVVQKDEQNCFYLEYKSMNYKMSVCSFIAFKSKLDTICIEKKLLSDPKSVDMEIVPLCNRDRFLILNLEEIIEVKSLIQGALVMLELNSIVHQRIHRASLV